MIHLSWLFLVDEKEAGMNAKYSPGGRLRRHLVIKLLPSTITVSNAHFLKESAELLCYQ